MPAIVNSLNQIELNGGGANGARCRQAVPTAPSGADSVLYVIRATADSSKSTSTTYNETPSWDPAAFIGFKFDNTYPLTTEDGGSEYDNFLGVASGDSSAPYTTSSFYYHNGSNILYFYNELYSGAASKISTFGAGDDAFLFRTASKTRYTWFWWIHTHPTDNSVLYQFWANNEYINLDALDLSQIDDNDPHSTYGGPIDKSGTLHGDTTGTNWRPSDGVMAFPTYFMAANPFAAEDIKIEYVGVKYSTLL